MRYSMIRYAENKDGGVSWVVIRAGKPVASGTGTNMENAIFLSEKAILDAFDTEKIATVVLSKDELSLVKTEK